MKKILYILTAFAFGLAACTQELDTQNTLPEDCIMLNVFNSPMTKAVNPAGAEYERQLNRLDCFFYVKGQTASDCVYYQKVELNKQGQAEIPFYVDETIINTIFPSGTTCDVFVIANLPEGTFTTGGAGTDVNTLSKILLDLEDEDHDYDAIDKPFVMAGLGEATKGANNNATGTIPLYRAAAKVTISVNVPAEIKGTVKVEGSDGTITEQETTFTPILTDDQGKATMKTSFHNGVTKTYLNTEFVDADGNSLIVADDFFYTEEYGYTFVSTTAATDTAPAKHLYTCEVPFYTYARAWEKGASDAAYLTLDMPWYNPVTDSNRTYYYQILVNAQGRSFEPNHWYDLTVNVGVLGSTVEQEPKLLEDLTFYVLDWTTEPESETGDRYENVDIQNYTYLIVHNQRLEINNATTGVINYDASHKIGWMMNTSSKIDEILKSTTTKAAFYINCATSTPTLADQSISTGNFTDDGRGGLTYNYEIPSTVYSPVYVYITIWLDIDGDGVMDNEEEEFTEDVTIVQYPPIYIIPDESCETSVYVNGTRNSSTNITFTQGDGSGSTVKLGGAKGYSEGNYMYVITVSSFAEDDTFALESGSSYNYIIGDPRQTTIDNNMHATYTFTDDWETAPATYPNSEYVNNTWTNTRTLQYYYPTATDPAAFQVIAPKFRVVSFNSTVGGGTNVDKAGAPLRCASYQEDGFPAGRWRVPTAAEINYVINLQDNNAITDIFVAGTNYFCSTGTVSVNNGFMTTNTTGSVRCVYDEWYWGSEREAKVNPAVTDTEAANYYLFTWGDEPR